jgi:histidinol-phosphate aminotransferase
VNRGSSIRGVKRHVLQVPAYSLRALDAAVKLNQNENPYDFPDDLKEEVIGRFRERSWSRYPDFVPDALRAKIAEFAGWQKEGILLGNGSNELLQATLMVLIRDRASVVIPAPTFTVYGLVARILGARVIRVALNPDMSYDAGELLKKSQQENARLLIVCTPNNPTGSILRETDLKMLLDGFSGHLLLDEAYFEFCGRTALRLLESYPRLIITRTFSKAMGMAGLRFGYLMAHPDLVAQISKAKLPYNINQFTLTAAQVALEHPERFQAAIRAILNERGRLKEAFEAIPGLKVYPSEANFFLLELPVSPHVVFEDLLESSILVRDVSAYPMLSRCIRITVGTPDENNRLLRALHSVLG